MNTTIPRRNYFEEVEPSDWSLVNFLGWRSKFSDFSDKEVEHSAWKTLLKNISNTSQYGDSTVKKAQELLSDFKSAKKSYGVKKFWEDHRSMYLDNRLKTISKEIELQMAVSDLKYVVNKSEEETSHSRLIRKRRHQLLKNELESTKKVLTQKQEQRQTRYGRNIPDYTTSLTNKYEFSKKKRKRPAEEASPVITNLRDHTSPSCDDFFDNYGESEADDSKIVEWEFDNAIPKWLEKGMLYYKELIS